MCIKTENRIIADVFADAVSRHGERPLIEVPADPDRAYHPGGYRITYGQAADQVAAIAARMQAAGYGHGHRIAVLAGSRPETLLMKLACAQLGISFVPVNPDYRISEIAYLLKDSGAGLAVTVPERAADIRAAIAENGDAVDVALLESGEWPASRTAPPKTGPVTPETESSLLYTSGSTGAPKGCILSHAYELACGEWYATRGGLFTLDEGAERVYCPLPLFHINAGVILFFGMIVTGNCQLIPERFSAARWWNDIRAMKATGCHYLGIVIPVLMNAPAEPGDRNHTLKWGIGAGVEPSLHRPFEERFGIPLIEVWGMTEMCRVLVDCHEPRMIDTRAMGRPQPGLEVRVVDENDTTVAPGEPGELCVRHSAETPRKGAFSGYLNQPEATEQAWRGGWFHTGDTVTQDESGMVFFVDRKKNIIRRSGENIAAAEVENCLQDHPQVDQVAVIAAPDELREEEVMACIVTHGAKDDAAARALFDHCFERLAYYKAPGWIVFVDSLPVTGTQKIQKHAIFGKDQDPRSHPMAFDLRAFKKR